MFTPLLYVVNLHYHLVVGDQLFQLEIYQRKLGKLPMQNCMSRLYLSTTNSKAIIPSYSNMLRVCIYICCICSSKLLTSLTYFLIVSLNTHV